MCDSLWGCHTYRLINWCLFHTFHPPPHLYIKRELPIGWASPHPPPPCLWFPGQPCQGGGKEQIMWEHSISFPSLSQCICVYKSFSLHASTLLSAPHCFAERSERDRREEDHGREEIPVLQQEPFLWPPFLFFTSCHSPQCVLGLPPFLPLPLLPPVKCLCSA